MVDGERETLRAHARLPARWSRRTYKIPPSPETGRFYIVPAAEERTGLIKEEEA